MGAIVTLSAGVLALAITVLLYFRRPPPALWPSLFFFSLSVTVWAFGELLTSYLTNDQQWYRVWLVFQYAGIFGLPPAWWIVTLQFAKLSGHRIRWADWRVHAAPIVFAGVAWLAMASNPLHQSFMLANVGEPNVRYALWYVAATGSYLLIIGSILVLAWLSTKPLTREYVVQVRIMLLGASLPLVTNLLYNARVLDLGFDFTVAAFSFLALVFSFSIFRHRLFALSPISLNHVIYREPNTLIIADREGRVCFANAAAESLFWSSAELANSPIFPVMDAVFEPADRPGVPPGFRALCGSTDSAHAISSGELLRLRGTDRFFVYVGTKIPGWRKGMVGFGIRLIDVTDVEKVRKQLAEQGGAMAAILETVREGILVVDADGRMVFFNDIFRNMWNLPEEIVEGGRDDEAIHHVLSQLVDPDAFVARIQELYASPHETSHRDEIRLKDGRMFERSSRPLYNGEHPIGRVWTFQDVTGARQLSEERQALELKVAEAHKLDSLGMLAGGIAHDFNNILVGVLGSAEFAMESVDEDSELRAELNDIVSAARRAGDLCRQLLAYSGRSRTATKALDLSELIEEMASLISVSVSRRCNVVTDLKPALPAVEADATQLRQIVMNLLTNAVEAVGDDDGDVIIRTGLAHCSRKDLDRLIADDDCVEGAYVYVEVSDSGCGIDEATQQRIFDPFFSTKRSSRGFGLAAVLGIARVHHAAIEMDSQLGRGTRIRVLFPASGAKIVSSDAEQRPDVQLSEATGKILVVDDEKHVLQIMKRTLRRAGYEVVTAKDGADAIRVIEARHQELKAVVLDLTMPGIDGSEAYERIRGIARQLPIVLASGYSRESVVKRLGAGNAPLFLQKPFQSDELLHALDTAIRTTN